MKGNLHALFYGNLSGAAIIVKYSKLIEIYHETYSILSFIVLKSIFGYDKMNSKWIVALFAIIIASMAPQEGNYEIFHRLSAEFPRKIFL